jgi:hypothetical protein
MANILGIRKIWEASALPLTVLFSPILKLRYRVAWDYCAKKINSSIGHVFFTSAIDASHLEAFSIEVDDESPPSSTVYICNCGSKITKAGSTAFYYNNSQVVAARIALPEEGKDFSSFVDITLNEALFCIGLDKNESLKQHYEKRIDLSKEIVTAINCCYYK